MEIKNFLQQLLLYGHHYNMQIAEKLNTEDAREESSSLRIFCHILHTHRMWNNRLLYRETATGIWDICPAEELTAMEKKNQAHSVDILTEMKPDDVIHYTNYKGDPHTNTVQDILFHVINHGTYHRGQIATLMRQSGMEPVQTDYILYKWEGF